MHTSVMFCIDKCMGNEVNLEAEIQSCEDYIARIKQGTLQDGMIGDVIEADGELRSNNLISSLAVKHYTNQLWIKRQADLLVENGVMEMDLESRPQRMAFTKAGALAVQAAANRSQNGHNSEASATKATPAPEIEENLEFKLTPIRADFCALLLKKSEPEQGGWVKPSGDKNPISPEWAEIIGTSARVVTETISYYSERGLVMVERINPRQVKSAITNLGLPEGVEKKLENALEDYRKRESKKDAKASYSQRNAQSLREIVDFIQEEISTLSKDPEDKTDLSYVDDLLDSGSKEDEKTAKTEMKRIIRESSERLHELIEFEETTGGYFRSLKVKFVSLRHDIERRIYVKDKISLEDARILEALSKIDIDRMSAGELETAIAKLENGLNRSSETD